MRILLYLIKYFKKFILFLILKVPNLNIFAIFLLGYWNSPETPKGLNHLPMWSPWSAEEAAGATWTQRTAYDKKGSSNLPETPRDQHACLWGPHGVPKKPWGPDGPKEPTMTNKGSSKLPETPEGSTRSSMGSPWSAEEAAGALWTQIYGM